MIIPVVVFAYNRIEALRRVLLSLAKQTPEKLYIHVDGPTEESSENYDLILEIINEYDFLKPEVLTSSKHKGLAKSIVGTIDKILKKYEAIIVLEDDCVPGEYFMKYMTDSLEKYKDKSNVYSVSGYTNNLPEMTKDAFFYGRPHYWGWGTWRRAWKRYRRNLGDALFEAEYKGIDLNKYGEFEVRLKKAIKDNVNRWSAGWVMAHYLDNALSLYPAKSHIQNIGTTGGTNGFTGGGRVRLASSYNGNLPIVGIDIRMMNILNVMNKKGGA